VGVLLLMNYSEQAVGYISMIELLGLLVLFSECQVVNLVCSEAVFDVAATRYAN
jgi:hypothetical protein